MIVLIGTPENGTFADLHLARLIGLACWAVGALGLSSCASESAPGVVASTLGGTPLYCEAGPTSARPGTVYTRVRSRRCAPGDAAISEKEFRERLEVTYCFGDRRQIYYERRDAGCENGDRTITAAQFRNRNVIPQTLGAKAAASDPLAAAGPPSGLDRECPVFASVPEPFRDETGFVKEARVRSSFARMHRLDRNVLLLYTCVCGQFLAFGEIGTSQLADLNRGIQEGLQAIGYSISGLSTKPGTISRWESEGEVTSLQSQNPPGRMRLYFGDTSCLATAISLASEDADRRHRSAIDKFFGSVRRFADLPADLAQGRDVAPSVSAEQSLTPAWTTSPPMAPSAARARRGAIAAASR